MRNYITSWKKCYKRFSFFCLFLFLFIYHSPSQIMNDSQVIKTGHWVYDNLRILSMSQKIVFFNENSMMTASELKFYFEQIDESSLDENLYELYEQTSDFLYGKNALLDLSPFMFDFRIKLNGELYYKSNKDIPWTFDYYYKDNLATFPIRIAFSDYIMIETDPFVGKSHYGSCQSDSFTNFPYRNGDIEFIFPRFSYGSSALLFDNWGLNFHIGKEGFQIGDSKIGSVIYNHTFETDSYANLNIFSKYFKYSMDLVQINNEKWFYLHQFTARLHKTFKFSALEGSMLNAPFELRFMNPLMIMHQFSAWTEYEREGYDENHFCAYLAGLIDWEPFSNVRFYALYAQNELQLPTERDRTGVLLPDSLGGQLGAEFIVPSKNGVWSGFTEVLYTTPYLYIKQNPESSLYRSRGDNLIKDEINTWVGSPFGPDSFAIKAGAAFTLPAKYSLNASYLFLAKGEHDFSIFKEDKAPSGIYTYYPYYYYQEYGGEDDDEEVYKKSRDNARWMWLCGTPYFLNQIEVEGSMSVNSKTSLEVKTVYTFIFNENHIGGKFEHGIEVDFALTYNLL